ncbi:nucleotide exchange factor GrpE [Halovenus marina]|uniref:nucleotide exchange factor GrpE n=1 Tax=Halovenus marina TaxID=3396621 RepID=UPI003F5560AD
MTEQDGDTDVAADDESAREETEGATTAEDTDARDESSDESEADPQRETLEEIAEKPDDVERALDAILSRNTDNDADDSAEGVSVSTDIDPEDVAVDAEVLEWVDAASVETTARVIEALRRERDRLESDLAETSERADDFESRLKRKQADFQNYKKRQQKRLEEEKQRATEDFVERILDVRDNLDRALDQDEGADIRSGLESTVEQFDEQLRRENVERIEPEPGQDTDPQRHEVLATVESDQPADSIASVHRTGYEMAGKVLRPAQVTVSGGSEE